MTLFMTSNDDVTCCSQALAHGLCRLGLRTAVVESDAVMAVMLYEETLTARHGQFTRNT